MSGAQSALLDNLLLARAQTSPANLCADSTSCCWIVRRLLRLVPGARLVDRLMLSVLYLELGKMGKFVLDGQEYLGTCLPHPVAWEGGAKILADA